MDGNAATGRGRRPAPLVPSQWLDLSRYRPSSVRWPARWRPNLLDVRLEMGQAIALAAALVLPFAGAARAEPMKCSTENQACVAACGKFTDQKIWRACVSACAQ